MCVDMRRAEPSHGQRETPNAHCRRPDSHTQRSHCVLKARSSSWIPSVVVNPRESVHYDIRNTQRTLAFVFSGKGIMPDPEKVQAIKNAPASTTASGVRSFLGMATYCAKCIPKFSDVSAPMRELTKKDKPFHWSEQQERSFQRIKELLTSAKVKAYFDTSKETELITNASPIGLSAFLMQRTSASDDRRVVAYVSQTLIPVEQRYSQTEKEALAIVWAIEKLHIYLYGSHFKLITDCKPVQLIFGNPKSKPPARIER